ncbi:hypothetical protein Pla175_13990 [Pirellulimonas nuda]|uniref:Carboxypeptidase regulatory-like domain-containing protein n=1 Tax=Pirellulimonas nuda TaxID=2528009 RepID=A0A518D973_9BACT|nr:hypothetical protein [Pirellulimonas nuda]QDU88029.1 hypothetical protein Pla175_13990 [Pirellulimonas nuda]
MERRAMGVRRGWWIGLVVTMCTGLSAGCGDGGPPKYKVSGVVTLAGQPAPGGEVVFQPDKAKENTGPRSVARIFEGRYETAPGQGVVGGAYYVTVMVTDGRTISEITPIGKPLIRRPYELEIDLPQADTQKDFDVPKK